MSNQRIIEHYKADVAAIGNTHQRQDARRYWLRAVMETLHERAITADPVPKRKTKVDHICRYKGFWYAVPDDELDELMDVLRPYFRRPENRHQPLD